MYVTATRNTFRRFSSAKKEGFAFCLVAGSTDVSLESGCDESDIFSLLQSFRKCPTELPGTIPVPALSSVARLCSTAEAPFHFQATRNRVSARGSTEQRDETPGIAR